MMPPRPLCCRFLSPNRYLHGIYRLSRVLTNESVAGPVAGILYQTAVASQLLYGSETWILPPSGLKCLEGFHVEAVWHLACMRLRTVKGKCVYPHSADVLKAAGLCTATECIARRRVNIAKSVEGVAGSSRSVGGDERRGTPSRTYWWEQELTFEERSGREERGHPFFGSKSKPV